MVKVSNITPLPSRIFGGGMNNFLDPPLSMNFFNDGGVFFFTSICKPNKKVDFICNCSSDKKKFIFPGRYLNAAHFEKKLDMGGGPFKNANGRGD